MFASQVWFCRNERILTDNVSSFLDGQCLLKVQNAIIFIRHFNDNEVTTRALNRTLCVANVIITSVSLCQNSYFTRRISIYPGKILNNCNHIVFAKPIVKWSDWYFKSLILILIENKLHNWFKHSFVFATYFKWVQMQST